MLKNIINKIRRRTKATLQSEHRIESAFVCGGTEYFWFPELFTMPVDRALDALPFYEELRMRCDREFLTAHCTAVESILSDPKKINIGKLAQLNIQLKERLEWI